MTVGLREVIKAAFSHTFDFLITLRNNTNGKQLEIEIAFTKISILFLGVYTFYD